MMINTFHFTLKAIFVLKIFELLSLNFGQVEKWLDAKDKVNSKTYDVTVWESNNCNAHITHYLKK